MPSSVEFISVQDNIISLKLNEYFNFLHSIHKDSPPLLSAKEYLKEPYSTWFSGRFLFGLINNSFSVGIRDLYIEHDFVYQAHLSKVLSIEYFLVGGSNTLLGNKSFKANGMPRIIVSSHATAGQQTRFHKKGEKIKSIGLWLSVDTLVEDFGLDMSELPKDIRPLLQLEQDITASIPISTPVHNILDDIFNASYTGKLAKQYYNAKFTELICQTISCFSSPELTYQKNNRLTRHKSNAMQSLLDILNGSLSEAHCLESLAEQLSMKWSSNIGHSFVA